MSEGAKGYVWGALAGLAGLAVLVLPIWLNGEQPSTPLVIVGGSLLLVSGWQFVPKTIRQLWAEAKAALPGLHDHEEDT